MRHLFHLLGIVAIMLVATSAAAQNIPIGKRIPDVKPQSWLNGVRPLRDSGLTCIEFYHPASKRSMANIDNLRQLAENFTRKDLQIVVVAAGDAEAVESALGSSTDEGVAVGLDTENNCFKAFGVTYLPACVIIDDQKKTVWAGDSKSLTMKLINNLKQK